MGRLVEPQESLLDRLSMSLPDFLLSPGDERVLRAVGEGVWVDFNVSSPEVDSVEHADHWGPDRTIHGQVIEWLLTDPGARVQLARRGLRIRGARIDGAVDARYSEVPFPVNFEGCLLTGEWNLEHSDLKTLSFLGSRIAVLKAAGAKITGDVILGGKSRTSGVVDIQGIAIGGELSCSRGEFHNPEGNALIADGAEIKGHLLLDDGFKAEGEVRLLGATIGGQLNCRTGKFHKLAGDALSADGAVIKGDILLSDGFWAEGTVRLLGVSIGGELDCRKGEFHKPDGDALSADQADIKGTVFLSDGFKAEGEVRFLGAIIGRQLNCEGGEFRKPRSDALCADGANIKGDVFLTDGFKTDGAVRLLGATIGGQLNCAKGEFHNPTGSALNVDQASVSGNVFLRDGFKAEGTVRLLGATIGGDLNCQSGEFHKPEGNALFADGADIGGDVLLSNGFKAEGTISFCRMSIPGQLIWRGVRDPKGASMDLRGSKVALLWDETESWPKPGRLYLHGFCYEDLADEAPRDVKSRIKWLRLQPAGNFLTQPYEQLAKVLREKGDDAAAKKIQMAKNADRGRRASMGSIARLAHWGLGILTGYGYRPLNSLGASLILVLIGWGLFYVGGREGIIQRLEAGRLVPNSGGETNYVDPDFHAFLYSLDAFLPIVSFGHTEHWAPNEHKVGHLVWRIRISGLALSICRWILNGTGWILASLFITTVTGTISRRL